VTGQLLLLLLLLCCFYRDSLVLGFFFLLINADMILFHCFTYGMYFSTVIYIVALHSRYTRALSVWIFINHPCPDVGLRPSGYHEVVGSLAHTDFFFLTARHFLTCCSRLLGLEYHGTNSEKFFFPYIFIYITLFFYHTLVLCEHKF
jgi:hypothetical protein